MADPAKNIFRCTDQWHETVTIDEFALKSGTKLVVLRVFGEDEQLQSSVQLKPGDLVGLRFAIDKHVTNGGDF